LKLERATREKKSNKRIPYLSEVGLSLLKERARQSFAYPYQKITNFFYYQRADREERDF